MISCFRVSEPTSARAVCPECGPPSDRRTIRAAAFRRCSVFACAFLLSALTLAGFCFAFGTATTTRSRAQIGFVDVVGSDLTLGDFRRIASGAQTASFDVPNIVASPSATLSVDIQNSMKFESDSFRIGWPAGIATFSTHAVNGSIASSPKRMAFHAGTLQSQTGGKSWSVSVWPPMLAFSMAVLLWIGTGTALRQFRWIPAQVGGLGSIVMGGVLGILLAFLPTWHHDVDRSAAIGPDIPLGVTVSQIFDIKDRDARARKFAELVAAAIDRAPYTDSEMQSAPYVPIALRQSWMTGALKSPGPPLSEPRPDSALPRFFVHQETDPVIGSHQILGTPLYQNSIYVNRSTNVFRRSPPHLEFIANGELIGFHYHGDSGNAVTVSAARLAITQFLVWLLFPAATVAFIQRLRYLQSSLRQLRGACVRCGYDLRGSCRART